MKVRFLLKLHLSKFSLKIFSQYEQPPLPPQCQAGEEFHFCSWEKQWALRPTAGAKEQGWLCKWLTPPMQWWATIIPALYPVPISKFGAQLCKWFVLGLLSAQHANQIIEKNVLPLNKQPKKTNTSVLCWGHLHPVESADCPKFETNKSRFYETLCPKPTVLLLFNFSCTHSS